MQTEMQTVETLFRLLHLGQEQSDLVLHALTYLYENLGKVHYFQIYSYFVNLKFTTLEAYSKVIVIPAYDSNSLA